MPPSRATHRLAGAIAVAVALGIGGCSSSEGLIPPAMVQDIEADGREWTYDVAWQNTRMVSHLVATKQLDSLTDEALILTARLHRLEMARAQPMADRRTARIVERLEATVAQRGSEHNRDRLREITPLLEDIFDRGDFAEAKRLSLEVLVIARSLEATP